MKMKCFNPILPNYEYIPDGEPHLFENRLYLYGSHDRFGGKVFCMNDYVCWSAPAEDLSDWRFEGIIYKKEQDPDYKGKGEYLYAPDVAQGLDGKYYLYYALWKSTVISVARSDTPSGPYEYYGKVRRENGVVLGSVPTDVFQYDPSVLVEDGRVYLGGGLGPAMKIQPKKMHGRALSGGNIYELEADMLTVREEHKDVIPMLGSKNPGSFSGHEFCEAASLRKYGDTYYFVYSSVLGHEMAYATSKYPDKDYTYRGCILSNADIFKAGDKAKAYYGNNHGGIVQVGEKYYMTYHRHTNKALSSRQICAEEIHILPDGSIPQVELTSCGLNGGPLEGLGAYSAAIACHLESKKGATVSMSLYLKSGKHPYFTQDGADRDDTPGQYIAKLSNGCSAGYCYFDLESLSRIRVTTRGAAGTMNITASEKGPVLCSIDIPKSGEWNVSEALANVPDGVSALLFTYQGKGTVDFQSFELV